MRQRYPFQNIPLPYGYTGLLPFIDEETLRLHHDKHLGAYIDNLNAVLKGIPELHGFTLERLIYAAKEIPGEDGVKIARNAGGVYNHFFYFDGMTPEKQSPAGRLADGVTRAFGSLESFEEKFKAAALGVFGSGYAWLACDTALKLQIVTTANQETPLTRKLFPLLCADVWEHAYYLKHYNVRADYLNDWLRLANYNRAEKILALF